MKKTARLVGTILSVCLLLGIAAGAFWLVLSGRPFPRTRGTIRLAGVQKPVEVLRDTDGVPHIYAESLPDLYFAQGFVHAQDRFWQMEFWRRIGAGRLSELFGKTSLPVDIYVRTMGFAAIAEREYAAADPDTRLALDAYAAGVNAYIGSRPPGKLGLEFALLRFQGVDIDIAPWRPSHSLTWLKIMSQDLGGNMDTELLAMDVIRSVGTAMAERFFAPYRAQTMPFIVSDAELGLLERTVVTAPPPTPGYEEALRALPSSLVGGFDAAGSLALGRGGGIGSNSWVVSGRLTASGKPILCNDPHMGIQMPSIWYEVGLHYRPQGLKAAAGSSPDELNVRGFSFAGVPGVIVGHNDRIAWGVTNAAPDVQDLYVERLNPENPDQYEVEGQWRDMEVRYERIEVHGEDEPYVLAARSTRHGPVVTDHGAMLRYAGFGLRALDVFPRTLTFSALSVRWTALRENTTMRAVLTLNRARDFAEFRQALRFWDIPSQNFVYADTQGNIGYQTPGLIPLRRTGDGRYPAPGWTDEYEWAGFIPFDDLPSVLNPEKGYIATANNPIVSSRYRYLIATEFSYGYRARRIVDLIEGAASEGRALDADAMRDFMADDRNLFALELRPYLTALQPEAEPARMALDILAGWDGSMGVDSVAATVFAYFATALVHETYADQIPEELWTAEKALSRGERLMNSLVALLAEPDNPWWDDRATPDLRESRDAILKQALAKAYGQAVKDLGRKTEKWQWGRVHTATFRSQTLGSSGIGIVEAMFNRGPVQVAGGMEQVNCTDYQLGDPYDVYAVSSMRQIVDLSDLSRSLTMHTTGQSGHARHPHYADFIDAWAAVQFHSTRWTRAEALKDSRDRLLISPR